MKTPNLRISFGLESGDSSSELDAYWLTLEQVLPIDETATIADAASILDEAFGINPCIESTSEPSVEPVVDEPGFWDIVGTQYQDSSNYCLTEDGTYTVQLKIYKSHQDEPYTLRLDQGEILSTTIVQETKSYDIPIERIDSYKLKYPVLARFEHEWLSGGASFTLLGNTINFSVDNVTGLLHVSFRTAHDLVEIQLECDENSEPQESNALAFYAGLVFDERLEPPELEQNNQSIACGGSRSRFETSPGMCRKTVSYYDLCQCSNLTNRIANRDYEEIYGTCSDLAKIPSSIFRDYVDCGITTGDMNTDEFFLEKCCELPSVLLGPNYVLPDCWKEYRRLKPVEPPENKDYYDTYYGQEAPVLYKPIPPKGGICGKWTIEQVLTPNDCCGAGIPDMVWVETHTNLQAGQSYVFTVMGGAGGKIWNASIEGLIIVGSGNSVRVDVTDCFCLPGYITVVDSCDNELYHAVESSEGFWRQMIVDPAFPDDPYYMDKDDPRIPWGQITDEEIHYNEPECTSWSSTSPTWQNDEWKLEQIWRGATFGYSGEYTEAQACAHLPHPSWIPSWARVKHVNHDGWYDCSETPAIVINSLANCPGSPYDWGRYYPVDYGLKVWKWECPDAPEELVYDDENSIKIIGPSTYGYCFWEGGRAPYTINITGDGFWTNAERNQIILNTNNTNFKLYTDSDVCGSCSITVTDRCGDSVSSSVNCTVGRWVDRGVNTSCFATGVFDFEYLASNNWHYSKEEGKYRQWETIHEGSFGSSETFNNISCADCGAVGSTTYDYWHSYDPYPDITPCMSNLPDWYPCEEWIGAPGGDRFACSPHAGMRYEEYVC